VKIDFQRIVRDWLTEADNKTYDVTIVLGIGALLITWCIGLFLVIKLHQSISLTDFATANAALIAATGAGSRLKPQAPINDKQ
jgi:hypothetical protein